MDKIQIFLFCFAFCRSTFDKKSKITFSNYTLDCIALCNVIEKLELSNSFMTKFKKQNLKIANKKSIQNQTKKKLWLNEIIKIRKQKER